MFTAFIMVKKWKELTDGKIKSNNAFMLWNSTWHYKETKN